MRAELLEQAAAELADELRKVILEATAANEQAAAVLEEAALRKATGNPPADHWHRHTDRIIDYYAPEVRDALAQVVQGDTVRHAIRAAYTSQHVQEARKQPQSPQNPPQSPQNPPQGAQSGPQRPPQALVAASGAAGAATAAAGLVGTAAGAGGALAAGGAAAAAYAAAVAGLLAGGLATAALAAVLAKLYRDAYLQGAYSAASDLGGTTLGEFKAVVDSALPPDYFERWQPGYDAVADQLTDGGLARLLANAGVWVHGMSETLVHRIGDAIGEAVAAGKSPREAAAAVDAILHDAERSLLIAETEYMRAYNAAVRAQLRAAGVTRVCWYSLPGACEKCVANQAASPISINDSWPFGDVPVHPRCRCHEAPCL